MKTDSNSDHRTMTDFETFKPLNIAVLTVSDSRTEADDKSGKLLVAELESSGHRCVHKSIVKDDKYQIRAALSQWIADPAVDAVLSTCLFFQIMISICLFFNPKLPRNIMAFNNLINLLCTGVNFVEYNFLKGFSELFVNPKKHVNLCWFWFF